MADRKQFYYVFKKKVGGGYQEYLHIQVITIHLEMCSCPPDEWKSSIHSCFFTLH